jgi:hypothetical protein
MANFEIDIWSYDTWGNEEDGYTVNDRCRITTLEQDHAPTDEEINTIIEEYFGTEKDGVSVDGGIGDDMHYEIILDDDENTDYPLGQILIEKVCGSIIYKGHRALRIGDTLFFTLSCAEEVLTVEEMGEVQEAE